MRRTMLLALALASVTLAAPRKKKKKPPPPPPPPPTAPQTVVADTVSDAVLKALLSSEKVQAFRVTSSDGLRPHPTEAVGPEFIRKDPGNELTPAQTAALKGLLFADKSFRWKVDVSRCNFRPDVSFQVHAGLETVETIVSFNCNQVMYILGKPGNRWLPSGAYDARPVRKQLMALAKETMPRDAATQNLK